MKAFNELGAAENLLGTQLNRLEEVTDVHSELDFDNKEDEDLWTLENDMKNMMDEYKIGKLKLLSLSSINQPQHTHI